MRVAFDLTALSAQLGKSPEHKELAKRISRFASASSFEIDLESAIASIEGLIEIQNQGAARVTFGQALMIHAVMLYCRAAVEDGNGRFKMGVTKNYSADLLAKHQDVVKLRNRTIAHFDVGAGRYGEGWTREKIVVVGSEHRDGIFHIWGRTNFLAQLILDLRELCEAALTTVRNAASARLAELSEQLANLLPNDPTLRSALENSPFNPESFFATTEAVEKFWAPGKMKHESFVMKATSSGVSLPAMPTEHVDLLKPEV